MLVGRKKTREEVYKHKGYSFFTGLNASWHEEFQFCVQEYIATCQNIDIVHSKLFAIKCAR